MKIWIDFNQNGSFTDPGEEVVYQGGFTYSPSGYILSGLLSIPSTATLGTTRMRVSLIEGGSTSSTPCGTYGYGETEDYLVDIYTPPACSGSPTGGTANASSSTVCPNTAFNLSLTGFSSSFSGISIQWEESPAGSGLWTPIPNATNSTYTVSAGITSAMDYHAVVTCANGGGFANSTTVSVGVSPFYVCYCGPATGVTLNSGFGSNYLTNVAIPTTTLANPTTTSNGYTLYYPTTTNTTATLTQGVQYQLNTTLAYSGYYTGVWIDYDGSGTFDTSEYIPVTYNSLSGTATFTVPLTATPGLTGMRLRTYWNSYNNTMACQPAYDYETEDYVLTIAAAVPCSGTPTAGFATGPVDTCAGVAFNLQLTGNSVGLGVSVQWEESPAGAGLWTPIPGATQPLYTVSAGITSPMDYHAVVTCANGGQFDISNTVSVTISPFYICYCGPKTGSQLNSYPINYLTSVEIPTTTLNNNTSSTSSPTGYTLFYPTTTTTTAQLTQGVSYTLNLMAPYSGYYAGVWIDYDQSGTFDSAEFINPTWNNTNGTASFNVPLTAIPGYTGMRVRLFYTGYSPLDACTTFDDYETEDYVIEIMQTTNCTGTPSAGTATGPIDVCANATFSIANSTYTIGQGITVQWQTAPSGSGLWTDIMGATNPSYTVSGGITSATDYRMYIVCANSSSSDTSNILTVGMSPFYSCYCASAALYTGDEEIYSVTVNGASTPAAYAGTNGCTTPAPGAGSMLSRYSNFTSLGALTSVQQGQSVSFTIQEDECDGPSYYSFGASIWIDFNQNGSFSDPGEQVFVEPATAQGPRNITGSFNIPPSAVPGNTGMRVIAAEGYSGTGLTPCLSFGYGETEDYTINITAAAACTGTPVAGTAYGPASACSGIPFTVTDTAFTYGAGITYQWQTSPGGANTWTDIPTATNTSYTEPSGISTPTDYRMIVTCSGSGLSDTSNVVSMSSTITAPWTYDVESQPANSGTGPLSECWLANPTPGFVYSWQVSGTGTTPSSGTGPTSAHSGTHFFFTEASYGSFTGTDIADLTTPLVDVSGLTVPQLSFWYHMFGTNINKLVILASTNGTTWNPIDSLIGAQQASQAGAWLQRSVSLAGYNSTVQIRFQGTQGTSFAGDISIDDISIAETPSCLTPSGLAATYPTTTSADVTWNTVVGAVGYEYAIDQTSTLAPNSSSTIMTTASNTPPTYPGLNANSTYYLHVRTDCGSNGYSAWTSLTMLTPITNDTCGGAVPVPWNGIITGDNTNATDDAPPSVSCGSATSGFYKGLWYTVTPVASGTLTLSLCTSSSSWDSYIRVYDGSCGSFISCVTYNDDFCGVLSETSFSAVSNTTYYVLVGGYGSGNGGPFTLTATGVPLEIKLLDINATNVENRNRIDWKTSSEDPGDFFVLERSSNGRDYSKLATIEAKGQPATYTYWDEAPVSGLNYYRLKTVTGSGKESYSEVVTAYVKGGSFAVEAFPNPVGDKLMVKAHGTTDNSALITISDAAGKTIKVISMTDQYAEIDMHGLAEGMYFVKYSDNTHNEVIKVNKK